MKNSLVLSTALICMAAVIITYMVMKPVYDCLKLSNPGGLIIRQHVGCIHGT